MKSESKGEHIELGYRSISRIPVCYNFPEFFMPDLTISFIGFIDGVVLIIAAIFAPQIGIDPNSEWGMGRWMLLALGLFVLCASALVNVPRINKISLVNKLLKASGLKTSLIFVHLWIFVLAFYIWFITYGNWTTWLHTTSYYDKLAKSFSEGHLYIDIKPDPALLAVSDPYSPGNRPTIQNDIWDMSLYKGKFYLYWGPVPALLITPIKFLSAKKITDNFVVFFAYSGLLIFNSLLIMEIRRKLFPAMPGWAVFICIFLMGLISPIMWSISEPNVYDAGVGAGQFFLMGGIYWVVTALDNPPSISNWRLFLAGIFWIGAAGSRALYAITISIIAGITLIWIIKNYNSTIPTQKLFLSLVSLILPILAGAILLGWYNWARFDSPLEFGLRYQISIWNLNKTYNLLFLPSYILPNLMAYLLQPLRLLPTFPFIQPVMAADFFKQLNMATPQLYYSGKIAGLIFSAPALLAALVNIMPIKVTNPDNDTLILDQSTYRFMVYIFAGAFLTGFTLLLIFFVGSMRYLVDVISPLTLLAILGYWRIMAARTAASGFKVRKFLLILITFLILLSTCISVLLAFSAETNRFQILNPDLFNRIAQFFSPIR